MPVDPLILDFTNPNASPQGQDAFDDLTLQRGVTNGVPSATGIWVDHNDIVFLPGSETVEDLLF